MNAQRREERRDGGLEAAFFRAVVIGDAAAAGSAVPCRIKHGERRHRSLVAPRRESSMSDRSSERDDGDKFEWGSDGEAEPLSASALSNLRVCSQSALDANKWALGKATSSTSLRFLPCQTAQDWSSDSNDGNKFEWGSDGEAEPLSASALSKLCVPSLSALDANEWARREAPSSSSLRFLPCQTGQDWSSDSDGAENSECGSDREAEPLCVVALSNINASGPSTLDFNQEVVEKDKKTKSLVYVESSKDEANMIITRCDNSKKSFDREVMNMFSNSCGGRKKERFRKKNKKKRKRYGDHEQENQSPMDDGHNKPMVFPNPMVGFGLPNDMVRPVNRILPKKAIGPPFFYYENVALAPKGVWETISRKLYGIEPEIVDSKYFCAAARKRGYIHNLPTENRKPLKSGPPETIFEAFPHYKKFWPSWDSRRQLNCLTTCVGGTKLAEQIECTLANADNPLSARVKKYVMDGCKANNFVWIGKNKVAPLEAHEMEKLLGFPKDHTRGVGIKQRCKSLGNSFQVDTVAFHLSVLKDMFPNGIKVLSLFTGIGGAEVALHRLGIHLKIVVSVEISKANRRIFRGWWNQTQPETSRLIKRFDVQDFTNDKVEFWTRKLDGFDLVIGGSPCNNLAGKNRFHRDGLKGEHSALFFEYFRILDAVKSVMARMSVKKKRVIAGL
uniref:Uncharacterized protein n=1 Tax=Avena sativa TaxID=4498 RepID=A0ACD5VD44_AVESA